MSSYSSRNIAIWEKFLYRSVTFVTIVISRFNWWHKAPSRQVFWGTYPLFKLCIQI